MKKSITLTKIIIVVLLSLPVNVHPLGIGDIKLHSFLNQKLDAEISLLVSADDDISKIKVNIASPEKFNERGVPWNYFLSTIKFETNLAPNTPALVRLSSTEPLKEPFLNFLLEVNWTKGSLYREFTVLVNPPATYTQASVPVVNPPIQQKVASKQPQPAVVVSTNKAKNNQYGPTSRADSIWKIAKKANVYPDVSMEQMIIAIYETNPKAFYQDNVSALMVAQTIVIPSKEVILKLSKKQALATFKQQDEQWKSQVTAENKVKQQVLDNAETSRQLELEAPDKTTAKDLIAKNNSGTKTEMTDLMTYVNKENLALANKLAKLEQQLETIQKILVLRNEQLAILQNQKSVPELDFKLNIIILFIVGICIYNLLMFAWTLSNKRRDQKADRMAENTFSSTNEMDIAEPSAEYLVDNPTDENSLLNEFIPSNFDSFDTEQDEIDPISEANVYLAYERYQQAEDLIRQAIIDYPEKNEYQLKLLEIFYATGNKNAFEEYALELVNAGRNNKPPFWAKVLDMAGELIPESSLFLTSFVEDTGLETEIAEEPEANRPDNADGDKKNTAEEKIVETKAAVSENIAPSPLDSKTKSSDLNLDVSDLTSQDGLETKLDLAKAYIDMGNPELAKEIAEQVLEKGNEEQKKIAQTIIEQSSLK